MKKENSEKHFREYQKNLNVYLDGNNLKKVNSTKNSKDSIELDIYSLPNILRFRFKKYAAILVLQILSEENLTYVFSQYRSSQQKGPKETV